MSKDIRQLNTEKNKQHFVHRNGVALGVPNFHGLPAGISSYESGPLTGR